jgi:hypothetical protein
MRNESKLQTDILCDLRSLGKYCECFKIEKTSDNGIPDIFFTTKMTGAVFVETKRSGEKAEKLQEVRIKRLCECGAKAFVCSTWKDWFYIKRLIGLNKENVIMAHDL